MKLKKARRYTLEETTKFRNSPTTLTIDIAEGTSEPAEIMFLKWAGNLKWERIFILTPNSN